MVFVPPWRAAASLISSACLLSVPIALVGLAYSLQIHWMASCSSANTPHETDAKAQNQDRRYNVISYFPYHALTHLRTYDQEEGNSKRNH